jgi:hypothetical protein
MVGALERWCGEPPRKWFIQMALPFESSPAPKDPRAARILAKTIYRELRGSGFSERDVMALVGELLSLVTSEVKAQPGRTRDR